MVILLVGAGLVLVALFLRGVTAAVSNAGAGAISSQYDAEEIVLSDDLANCFGKKSRGALQMRGNGGLVLTEELLHFIPLAGTPRVKVALEDVTEVKLVGSFLGKTVGRKLLAVSWKDGEGDDTAAFVVKEPEQWRSEIERLRAAE